MRGISAMPDCTAVNPSRYRGRTRNPSDTTSAVRPIAKTSRDAPSRRARHAAQPAGIRKSVGSSGIGLPGLSPA